jgi:hypothetical protein
MRRGDEQHERILLVRPRAGLNDVLNQVVRSAEWAQQLNRLLIVDAAWGSFGDDMGHYFGVRDSSTRMRLSFDPAEIAGMSLAPKFLNSDVLSTYRDVQVPFDDLPRGGLIIDAKTRSILSARVVPDVRAQVILDHPIGGGDRGVELLQNLVLQPQLRHHILQRIQSMPQRYSGIHIRHTDIQTNMNDAIRRISALDQSMPLFVASDNSNVFDALRKAFPRRYILGDTFKVEGGMPLHKKTSPLNPRVRNTHALSDLFLLALSSELLVPNQTFNGSPRSSGFSRLAQALHREPETVLRLLGASTGHELRTMASSERLAGHA